MKIDLVIMSSALNNELKNMTKDCIRTFAQNTEYERIVVMEEKPVMYDGTITIKQTLPHNINRCYNEGFKKTVSDWVCFANNDVVFLPNWSRIIEHSQYDSLSPVNPIWEKHKGLTGVIEGYTSGVEVAGWCIVVKRSTMQKIGGLNEEMDFLYTEDIYAEQLKIHGLKHALVCDSHVIHLLHKTINVIGNRVSMIAGQKEKFELVKNNLWQQLTNSRIG